MNHEGDSDSPGSTAGNVLGTLHGVKAIPSEWLEPLELHDVITEVAEALCAFRDRWIGEDSTSDEESQGIWRKYPGF